MSETKPLRVAQHHQIQCQHDGAAEVAKRKAEAGDPAYIFWGRDLWQKSIVKNIGCRKANLCHEEENRTTPVLTLIGEIQHGSGAGAHIAEECEEPLLCTRRVGDGTQYWC